MKKLTLILILTIICNFLIAETQTELCFLNYEIVKKQDLKGNLNSIIQGNKDDFFEQNYYVFFNKDVE